MPDLEAAIKQQIIEGYQNIQKQLMDENSVLSVEIKKLQSYVKEIRTKTQQDLAESRRYLKGQTISFLLRQRRNKNTARVGYFKAYEQINIVRNLFLQSFFNNNEENYSITYAFYIKVDGKMTRYNVPELKLSAIKADVLKYKHEARGFELQLKTSQKVLEELADSTESDIINQLYTNISNVLTNPPPPIVSNNYLPEIVETYARFKLGMKVDGTFPQTPVVPNYFDLPELYHMYGAAKNNRPWYSGGDVGTVQVKGSGADLTTWMSLENSINFILQSVEILKNKSQLDSNDIQNLNLRVAQLIQVTDDSIKDATEQIMSAFKNK